MRRVSWYGVVVYTVSALSVTCFIAGLATGKNWLVGIGFGFNLILVFLTEREERRRGATSDQIRSKRLKIEIAYILGIAALLLIALWVWRMVK